MLIKDSGGNPVSGIFDFDDLYDDYSFTIQNDELDLVVFYEDEKLRWTMTMRNIQMIFQSVLSFSMTDELP